jgi:pimeloyl-ACP methyl ester carboxylesterase
MPTTSYQQAVISYQKIGTGGEILLLFHGFGQDQTAFNKLSSAFANTYTSYCIDLFFHGNSQWNYHDKPIEKEFFHGLISQFLAENQIMEFSLLGFSIGCRSAVTCAELFPEKVKEIYLLAPDNLQPSVWFKIATSTTFGRKIFKYVCQHPAGWRQIITIAKKLKLADKTLLRFARLQMEKEETRLKVYHTWMVYRKLKCDLKSFCQVIKSNRIALTVIVGRRDSVIPPARVSILNNYLNTHHTLIIESNHTGLIGGSIEQIQKIKK